MGDSPTGVLVRRVAHRGRRASRSGSSERASCPHDHCTRASKSLVPLPLRPSPNGTTWAFGAGRPRFRPRRSRVPGRIVQSRRAGVARIPRTGAAAAVRRAPRPHRHRGFRVTGMRYRRRVPRRRHVQRFLVGTWEERRRLPHASLAWDDPDAERSPPVLALARVPHPAESPRRRRPGVRLGEFRERAAAPYREGVDQGREVSPREFRADQDGVALAGDRRVRPLYERRGVRAERPGRRVGPAADHDDDLAGTCSTRRSRACRAGRFGVQTVGSGDFSMP
jgi:hypothetical protein